MFSFTYLNLTHILEHTLHYFNTIIFQWNIYHGNTRKFIHFIFKINVAVFIEVWNVFAWRYLRLLRYILTWNIESCYRTFWHQISLLFSSVFRNIHTHFASPNDNYFISISYILQHLYRSVTFLQIYIIKSYKDVYDPEFVINLLSFHEKYIWSVTKILDVCGSQT